MPPIGGPSGLSFVSGTSDRPLLYRTVDGVLKAAAEELPERAALVAPFQSVRFTFAELDREVERVARGMLACGLEPGERIGIWAPNCIEWVLTMFAAARAGLVLVNVNPAYRSTELEFSLRLVGCRALVFAPRFKTSDYAAMLNALIPELRTAPPGRLRCAAFPELRLLVQLGREPLDGTLSFEDLLAAGHDGDEATTASYTRRLSSERLDADQIFNIQFTSGTTGTPKGATLTHFNIVNNGFFVGEGMRLNADDKVCIPVPLVSLLRHGARGAGGHDPRRRERAVRRRLRAAGGAGDRGQGALHGAAWRAYHVHCGTGAPALRRVRSVVAAHRHHGRIAVSDRRDAPGRRRDAHAGSDDLLRHDGDQPGQLSEPAGRSPRAARRDRRAGASRMCR